MAATGAAWDACNFEGGLADLLSCVRDALGQFGRATSTKAEGREHAEPREHHGPWERGFAGRRGPGHWGGGFVGPRGGWWPGPPSAPPGPKASRGDVREVFGTLDNNLFAKVNTIISKRTRDSKQYAEKEK